MRIPSDRPGAWAASAQLAKDFPRPAGNTMLPFWVEKTDRAQPAYTHAINILGIRAMIEKNLGNLERVVRLALGVCFAIWTMLQPTMNGIEWLVMVVSLALILNGVFSRCYLWYILDIDSSAKDGTTRHTGAC